MCCAATLCALLLTTLGAQSSQGQSLSLKRALTTSVAPGCDIVAPSRVPVRRDNAEARRLSATGQEAALTGDRVAARAAFVRAAALNPGDERIAYDLGRAHEELADTSGAVGEFCRYLALSPDGREAQDVRSRLPRLVSRTALESAERATTSFRSGLELYDTRRFVAAADAFAETVRRAPAAAEGLFNRGLARAAAGRRSDAAKDLDAYLIANPTADDRTMVARAIDLLRRPVYSASSAFSRGLLPGFGQFYTGRPGRGVVVLALAAGAGGMAWYQKTETKQVQYRDPNGVLVPYDSTSTKRPYLSTALAVGAAVTLGAAIEAARFALHSSSGVARVANLAPYVGPRGDVGLMVQLPVMARF